MGSIEQRKRDLERYPKFKEAYLRAFERMLNNYDWRIADDAGGGYYKNGSRIEWTDASKVYDWWFKM